MTPQTTGCRLYSKEPMEAEAMHAVAEIFSRYAGAKIPLPRAGLEGKEGTLSIGRQGKEFCFPIGRHVGRQLFRNFSEEPVPS
jgi:hypothetical protein